MDSVLAHFPAKIGIAAWFQPKQTTELKAIYSFHPTDSFISMSTIKLPIAIACFKEIEKGNLAFPKKVKYTSEDLLRNTYSPMRDSVNDVFETTLKSCLLYACKYSDNIATDKILDALGGTKKTQEQLSAMHIKGLGVGTFYREMNKARLGMNWASPNGMNQLLTDLSGGKLLNQKNTTLLLSWLRDTPTGPNRIKGLLDKNIPVAHKTGTYFENENSPVIALNDVGIIELPEGKLFLSFFINESTANSAACENLMANISKELVVWVRQ